MRRFRADAKDLPRLRMNRRILRLIEEATSSAKLERCSVDEEHQAAMRLYLDTWVVGRLEKAINDILGVKA
jgi:hypothetical protein